MDNNVIDFSRDKKYLGNPDQLYGVSRLQVDEGRAKGSSIFEVDTGGRLQYKVLADCGLDIGPVSYKGYNITFLGRNGLVSPYFSFPFNEEFNNTFNGGLMYTCGLLNIGNPNRDCGQDFPLHGRYHYQSADQLCSQTGFDTNLKTNLINISGRVRESLLYGHNLEMHRSIASVIGGTDIYVHDVLLNRLPIPQEYMLLYHCNIGYPFFEPGIKITEPAHTRVIGIDQFSNSELDKRSIVTEPEDDRPEQVFSYDLSKDKEYSCVDIENPDLHIGLKISWTVAHLPIMTQWRSLRSGDYAMAFEPCTNYVYGRSKARTEKALKTLQGNSKVEMDIVFHFYEI